MTFGSNVQPRRRVRAPRDDWYCDCLEPLEEPRGDDLEAALRAAFAEPIRPADAARAALYGFRLRPRLNPPGLRRCGRCGRGRP